MTEPLHPDPLPREERRDELEAENDPSLELHQMRPTTRFSERAEDYSRYRPDYPASAIDAILEGLGEPERLVAADIGAGTGISSKQLAVRGVRVLAVEPNAEMRAQGLRHPRLEWRDGTAEASGLPDASVDLVLSAQAFHWFRQDEAVFEFHRILGPGGRLALMWNSRDRSDPLTLGYVEAIHAVQGEHPAERRHSLDGERAARVSGSGHFTPPTLLAFPHRQELDLAGLIGRARSASYVPIGGDALRRLEELLRDLFERHRDEQGRVTLHYITQVYRADHR